MAIGTSALLNKIKLDQIWVAKVTKLPSWWLVLRHENLSSWSECGNAEEEPKINSVFQWCWSLI
jgi:hypothetical protein